MATVTPLKALNLDTSEQETFIRFFKSLPEKPATTIRVFSRDDYYTLHGGDAIFAAKEVFVSTSVVKSMGVVSPLDYTVLSRGNFERFVRDLLLVKQYRVEVYTKQGNKNNDWKIEYKGSPGNVMQFENILFNSGEICTNSCVIALKIMMNAGIRTVGLSCIDMDAQQISICEFPDNELLSELEAIVVQLGPKECLLPTGDALDLKRMELVMTRNNILISRVPKADFNPATIEQDLNKLLHFKASQQRSCASLPEMAYKSALCGANALIKYFELMTSTTYFDQFKLVLFDVKRYVHMDSGAIASLNILPAPDMPVQRETSILGLLDGCRTAQGHRLIRQWLKQPVRDMNVIQERHDVVEALMNNSELRNALHDDYLRGVPDLLTLSKRIMHKKAGLQDCYALYKIIDRLPIMLRDLKQEHDKSLRSAVVEPLEECLQDLDKYQQMIEQTIDLEAVDKGEYLVKANFDDDLLEIQKKKEKLEEKINVQLQKACRDLRIDSSKIKLETTAQHGYFFRVTLKDEQDLRQHSKKYKIIDAIKGGVRFTTDVLAELNTDYDEIRTQYEEQQKHVVTEIITIASSYSGAVMSLDSVIAKLDVLVAFAHTAASAAIPFTRPRILAEGSGILEIKQARHPCVEVQENISFIPNDLCFKKEDHTFQIITGPNMGGKSTFIRSIGIIVLMAHVGSFVPCEEATITMVDSILARVGADDCETKGLSTFMVEMIESAAVLRSVTEKSLVIVDELGRGTSTYDGCGIAWSIAEYLSNVKAFTLFATHFHEITRMADECTNVKNRHVTALTQDGEFTILYQLRDGACDESFGIHIARMLQLPPSVIQFAEKLHKEMDPRVNMDPNINSEEKRKLTVDGQNFIENLFAPYEKMDFSNSTDEEISSMITSLRSKARDQKNPYLKSLMSSLPVSSTEETNGSKQVNGKTYEKNSFPDGQNDNKENKQYNSWEDAFMDAEDF